ncbi:Protoporphyrinogen oxidase [Thelephora ganbajun]|uniref:Protoporphyrinogen oxidase n=1 Tax=Thelephora ganbajun TaxID=370292 RepID=A0ACB6ZE41_THEGA|nr:Protoporphyrinogen oxidase [Thelephora ganbajun]
MRQPQRTKIRAYGSLRCTSVVRGYNGSLFCRREEPHIAILGGGITGLSATYHLARKYPATRITLIEGSDRAGGWLDSHRVDVGAGTVLLEKGPRTLRSSSKPALELINLLGLENELLTVANSEPAAQTRFLYVNNSSSGLSPLPSPSSLLSFITSPVSGKIFGGLQRDFWTAYNRPNVEDESVDAFFTRRFGSEFARIFASALVHGIYATDSRKLSLRAAYPMLWNAEAYGSGSVVWGALKPKPKRLVDDSSSYELGNSLPELMKNAAVYSFRGGLSTLSNALVYAIKSRNNVEIRTGDLISSVNLGEPFRIITKSGSVVSPTHIISALPVKQLDAVLRAADTERNDTLLTLTSSRSPESSTIHVTNFIFPPSKKPLHPLGFGYLIPRPVEGYESEENSQGMLGTIFDTVSMGRQDTADGYTKMGIISGGPYPSASTGPNVDVLLKVLRKHLGDRYELPNPIYSMTTECKECIPLFEPGHLKWVEKLRSTLKYYGENKVQIIGAGIGGVSIPDCIEQGRSSSVEITL